MRLDDFTVYLRYLSLSDEDMAWNAVKEHSRNFDFARRRMYRYLLDNGSGNVPINGSGNVPIKGQVLGSLIETAGTREIEALGMFDEFRRYFRALPSIPTHTLLKKIHSTVNCLY